MQENKQIYSTPEIEVLEIEVEQGFAASGAGESFGNENGAWN